MHLVDLVLFAHIAIAIAAFAVAGTLHASQWFSRSAQTVGELRTWVRAAHRLEPMFPILAAVLFGLGAWLVQLSDGEFRWGSGWVITSAVTLGLMELLGGAILAPRAKKAYELLGGAGDGPADATLHAAACDPVVWTVSHLVTGMALGVVFLMATKPSGAASILVVAIAGLLAAAIGAAGARSGTPVAVLEPTTA
jgi:hypothetical protein